MPVQSKAQLKFMAMIATGKKQVNGLTPSKAASFMKHTNINRIPQKKG